MALGFAPYLLFHSKEVFKNATPSLKITPPGYTRMLLENSRPNIVSKGVDDGSGHIKEVRIKARTRLPKGQTSTTDSCDIDARPAYTEQTISATMYRKLAVFLDDDTIAHYETDASKMMTGTGFKGITPFMQEQYDMLLEQLNGLMSDINDDLLTKQVTNFGVNQTNGFATAKTINFPLATTANPLAQGMTMAMADARANEFSLNDAVVVGNGLIDNYYLQIPAKGLAQNGLNTNQLALPNFYQDYDSASAWGADQFGIFQKNAVQFVDINRYVGSFSGQKGQSWFGTWTVPVVDSHGNVFPFTFDIQMKYIDCPTEVVIGGYGDPVTVNRGWVLIISKSFDQFNIPSTAYAAADRLTGNNGTLRYTATNV